MRSDKLRTLNIRAQTPKTKKCQQIQEIFDNQELKGNVLVSTVQIDARIGEGKQN